MMPENTGTLLPPDFLLGNFSGMVENVTYLQPTAMSSFSNYSVTEFADYPSSSPMSLDPNVTVAFDDYNDTDYNCTNEYCISDEDYKDLIQAYIFPTSYEWVLIALHSVVFLAGLIGNALVCVAVYRNHSMRTVTNYFIVNLAVADFMVILFCLPPTVVWDVTETWFLGKALCKIVVYFQVGFFILIQ